MITYEQLWAEKYAARFYAMEAEESARRAEDFLDLPRQVCGLPLRAMTPRDLLILDYDQSPFVCGGEITAPRIAQFLCALHVEPPRGIFSERRFFKHCADLVFADSVAAIRIYCDRIFADGPRRRPTEDSGRPIGVSFVAPLIVRIAAGIPSLSPAAIMDTPLPQLFQFQKILAAEEAARRNKPFRDTSEKDNLQAQCLEEYNKLLASEASVSVAEASAPPMRSPERAASEGAI